MSSFVSRGIKVFAKDDGFLLTRKRSEGRMKRYESAHDLRAWCLSDEEKRRYLIELMQRSSGSEGAYGKYIPVPTLISLMMALKDVQIEDLEKTLAAYRNLNLTDEQRAQLNKQLGQSGDKNLKGKDSTTVLFRRKERICRCALPMEKQELMTRIGELQDELERRDKEAKRQMSCLEKCISKEKRRVEKVKQSLANERRLSELDSTTSSCAERTDNALRQVEADQSTICALECKLSDLQAANRELQSLLDVEKRKPSCDPKQLGAMEEMRDKMEAAQSSEAAMRAKLSSLETFLRRSSNSFSRASACTGPACVQQRRSCEPRQSTPPGDFHPSPPRSQSVSPNRSRIPSEDCSRCSLPSDDGSRSSDTDRSRSRSAHRCRPPFVSTPGKSQTTDIPEKSSTCDPCSENRRQPPPAPEIRQPPVPHVRMAVPSSTCATSCQPCSEKRMREESVPGQPRCRQERSRTPGPQVGMLLDSSGSLGGCQPCARRSLSGGPDFNVRRYKPPEQADDGRAGTGHRDCWTLMVSRPKNCPTPSPLSVASGESEDVSDVSDYDIESPARDYICTSRSPSPSTSCRKATCPSSPTTCRSFREPSPVSCRNAPAECPADSFRLVSETFRAPVTRQPSPLTGEQRGNESACPGPNVTCRGAGMRDPSPVMGARKGFMDARIPASNNTCRGSGIRTPSPVTGEQRMMTNKIKFQSPVMRDPSPICDNRRMITDQCRIQARGRGSMIKDPSLILADSRPQYLSTASKGQPTAFTDRRVVLDASKLPPSRRQSPKPTERRNLQSNASSRRQSPTRLGERKVIADNGGGSGIRRQSPVTLDGRAATDPRRTQTTNGSCRGQLPMPTVLRCPSRDPSPAGCGRQAVPAERCRIVREPSCPVPQVVQCLPAEHPALRKSVPFSSTQKNERCGNQAKRR